MKNQENATPAMKSLKDRAKELAVLSPLMEGREKGKTEDLVGQISTITDFDFVQTDDGGYVVFIVKERPKTFYFGGMVLTDTMHKLDDEGYGAAVRSEGLPVRFEMKESRNLDKTGKFHLKYTNAILYPEG